jgi:hypothetical protein
VLDEEGARARAILDALASRERSRRLTGSYIQLIAGAATLGAATVAQAQSHDTYGPAAWIIGGSFALHGVIGLVTQGPLESLAGHASMQSDAALRDSWGAMARSARSDRLFEGWLSVGMGTLVMGTGTAIGIDADTRGSAERTGWSVGLLLAGAACTGVGIATLLVPSGVEVGYQAAYRTEPTPPPMRVGVAPLPGGATLSLGGTF